MEGYMGLLRSHADEGTQHVTQTQENEPVLVRDVTSSGHLYQPVLVARRSSTGHFADQYWSKTPTRRGAFPPPLREHLPYPTKDRPRI